MAERGRFAPSPTGALHLGGAATALLAAARARALGGSLILRMEDLDRPRVVPGAAAQLLADLGWLGLAWNEGPDVGGPFAPYTQSERLPRYDAALEALAARGLTYLCDCSRAEVARASSAPHAGEEGPRYPGTCRPLGHRPRAFKRPPAIRLAVPPGPVAFEDAAEGPREEDVAERTGDFVLRRADGLHAYQLAVVVDDLEMGITEVVRGADLAPSAARQALLHRLLGSPRPPRFLHVPLLVGADGERLAKRAPRMTVGEHAQAGRTGGALAGALARAYGLPVPRGAARVDDLAPLVRDLGGWPRAPVTAARVLEELGPPTLGD